MRKRRSIRLCCIFFSIMLVSLPKISIAETNVASTIETSFERISESQAEAEVDVFFQSPRTIEIEMELQRKSLNAANYTTVEGPFQRSVGNRMYLNWVKLFNIENEYLYRVKFQITDTVNGIQNTVIRYEYL